MEIKEEPASALAEKNTITLNHIVNGFEITTIKSRQYLDFVIYNSEKEKISKLKINITNGNIVSFWSINNDTICNFIFKSCLLENDIGMIDQFLYTCLATKFISNSGMLKLPDYFPNGYSEFNDDYFDSKKPTKQTFLRFLDIRDELQNGLIVVPVTVKDHFSTLFIDLKTDKMLCLFDSGLGHSEEKHLEDEISESEGEEILQFTNPIAAEFVFGENLAKDIMCLNNYCLQDEQSCGYWTIAACELGTSAEYGDIDAIIRDCEDGIFQIKLAQRVLEITDDIVKGMKQNIILINPNLIQLVIHNIKNRIM